MSFNEWFNEDDHDLYNYPEEAVESAWDYQQSKIDRLMMEHCPEEMTEEQIDNFEKHQKISDLKLIEE